MVPIDIFLNIGDCYFRADNVLEINITKGEALIVYSINNNEIKERVIKLSEPQIKDLRGLMSNFILRFTN
ncbi:MAG: hypothetical protein ABIH42_08660 [Planctomycetota bacterium]